MQMKFLKKMLKWLAVAVLLGLALLQLTNPARTNPPAKTDFLATLHPPPDLAAEFRAACYDCHSDETRWPWYSHIAPISWQVAQDVAEGRYNLNLSEWPADNAKRQWKKMEDMSEEIGDGEMPLKKYTLIHRDARLTAGERQALTAWLDQEVDQLKSRNRRK